MLLLPPYPASNYMKDMAEVITDTNNQCKRRLPAWVQSNNTSKNEKFEKLDAKYSTSRKRKETLDAVSRKDFMSSETDLVLVEKKKDPEDRNNHSNKKARKLKRHVSSIDSTCSSIRSKGKFEADIIAEDEVELTVEDLISIAEEFLTADKGMQQEQSVTRESKSSESNSIPTSSPVALEGDLSGGIRSGQLLSKCNQTSCLSSNEITKSGDAAQDMLELLLGPLLKAPPPRRSDQEMTRELLISTFESDNRVRSLVDAEEHEPSKKKSSLKDKVACLLTNG